MMQTMMETMTLIIHDDCVGEFGGGIGGGAYWLEVMKMTKMKPNTNTIRLIMMIVSEVVDMVLIGWR